MGWSPRSIRCHDVLVGIVSISDRSVVSLTFVTSTSDSTFLLNGVVNVVLFCTIRRVIPVKEVAAALFTGKIFRAQEKSSGETTWCIGSMEAGEKRTSADLSLPTSNDHFVLRQPKFEIITPPPAVHCAHTIQPVPVIRTEAVFHADAPQSPVSGATSISRPLPREPSICSDDGEGCDRSSSFSRQSSIRRLPPVPHGPQSTVLPSVIEKRETPPPPYLPAKAHSRQHVGSSSAPSHSRSPSRDSVASDMSGSTLFGSTDRGGPKDGDFPSQR
jgi:hypothetical protein